MSNSPSSEAAFLERLQPGDGVIDVGANCADYTLAYAERVGRDGCVVSVEPDPSLAQHCRQRCVGLPQVHVLTAAVSDAAGVAPFYIDTFDRRRSSLWSINVGEARSVILAPVLTLDMIAAVVPRLRGIKIDAQGAEARILKGSPVSMSKDELVWLVEIWPNGLRAAGDSSEGIVSICTGAQLRPFNGWDRLAAMDPNKPHANHDFCLAKDW